MSRQCSWGREHSWPRVLGKEGRQGMSGNAAPRGAPEGARTLALLSRSPTKVESSSDGESGECGRSSLARAGKGAAGGSSCSVTV